MKKSNAVKPRNKVAQSPLLKKGGCFYTQQSKAVNRRSRYQVKLVLKQVL